MVEAEYQVKRSGRPSKFKAVQSFCSQPESIQSTQKAPPKVTVLPRLPPRPRAAPNTPTDPEGTNEVIEEIISEEKIESTREEIVEQPCVEPNEILKRLRAKSTLVPIGLHAILSQPCPAIPRRPMRLSDGNEETDVAIE